MPKSETAYLYVLGCKDGPYKVGYSYAPASRVKAMTREGRRDVFIVGSWPVGVRIARAAERYAHWLLRDRHLEREWFNVSHDEAVSAVVKALEPDVIASYDPREMIPALVTTSKKIKDGEYITTKFPKGTRGLLSAVLLEGEQQADLIREAIDREIARREREKRKKDS